MRIIDGKAIAAAARAEIRDAVSQLSGQPGLAIILIGDDPASHIYVGLKEAAAEEAGMYFEKYLLPTDISQDEVISLIKSLNSKPAIHGIVVQFPLPSGYDGDAVVAAIDPAKDVDGFHPDNIKALLAGKPRLIPALVACIDQLITRTGEELSRKQALIVANSSVLSEPLRYVLQQRGLHVGIVEPEARTLPADVGLADVVVVAIGRPRFLTGAMVKPGAIVIDVGYNRVDDQAVGDVDAESVREQAGWLTPVPGGVGPMTVAMLLKNVLHAYALQER